MSKPKLSILIPTIPDRHLSYIDLYSELTKQVKRCEQLHPTLGTVEILTNESPKYINGGLTVGAKRDSLLHKAKGDYVAFVDDDEFISPNYIEEMLRMCNEGNDICCFRSLFKCDTYIAVIDMDLHHTFNAEANPEYITFRRPFHVCAIKRDLAQRYHFPDKNNAEDWAYMEQVLKDVKTQSKRNMILHLYNHSASTSAVDEIERQ